MRKILKVFVFTLVAHLSTGALAAGALPEGRSKTLKPVTAEEFKAGPSKNNKSSPGVRDHLNLTPVTAEEFKAGPPKKSKSVPSVRDHMKLRPVTAEEFKAKPRAGRP